MVREYRGEEAGKCIRKLKSRLFSMLCWLLRGSIDMFCPLLIGVTIGPIGIHQILSHHSTSILIPR